MEDITNNIDEFGIKLHISTMPTNGEKRTRVLFKDGTSYIRTEMNNDSEGWQKAHYHRGLLETIIVQKGSIIFAELKDQDIIYYKLKKGDRFTIDKKNPHNIYMMKNAIIHTVKHSEPEIHPKNNSDWWDDTDDCIKLNSINESIDKIMDKLIETNEIEENSARPNIIVIENKTPRFNSIYMHFDNLIWQFPMWIVGLLTIGITTIELNNKIILLGTIPVNISSFLFLAIGIFGAFLSYAMYRFRCNQIMEKIKEKNRHVSPQSLIQIFLHVLVLISLLIFIFNFLIIEINKKCFLIVIISIIILIIIDIIFSIFLEKNIQKMSNCDKDNKDTIGS